MLKHQTCIIVTVGSIFGGRGMWIWYLETGSQFFCPQSWQLWKAFTCSCPLRLSCLPQCQWVRRCRQDPPQTLRTASHWWCTWILFPSQFWSGIRWQLTWDHRSQRWWSWCTEQPDKRLLALLVSWSPMLSWLSLHLQRLFGLEALLVSGKIPESRRSKPSVGFLKKNRLCSLPSCSTGLNLGTLIPASSFTRLDISTMSVSTAFNAFVYWPCP